MKNYPTNNKTRRSGANCLSITRSAIVIIAIIISLQSSTQLAKVCLEKSYTREQYYDKPNLKIVPQGNEYWEKERVNDNNYRILDAYGNITMDREDLLYNAFESYGKEAYNSQSNYNKLPGIKEDERKAYNTPFLSEDSGKRLHIIVD